MKKRGERKVAAVQPVFVETIPADTSELQAGKLYISMKYNTLVHRCPCGCGGLSEIGLHPATRRMIFDGKRVSIEPSIGARSLPCRSHYWISNNLIVWAEELAEELDNCYDTKRRHLAGAYSKQPGDQETPAEVNRWWTALLRKAQRWLGR